MPKKLTPETVRGKSDTYDLYELMPDLLVSYKTISIKFDTSEDVWLIEATNKFQNSVSNALH